MLMPLGACSEHNHNIYVLLLARNCRSSQMLFGIYEANKKALMEDLDLYYIYPNVNSDIPRILCAEPPSQRRLSKLSRRISSRSQLPCGLKDGLLCSLCRHLQLRVVEV